MRASAPKNPKWKTEKWQRWRQMTRTVAPSPIPNSVAGIQKQVIEWDGNDSESAPACVRLLPQQSKSEWCGANHRCQQQEPAITPHKYLAQYIRLRIGHTHKTLPHLGPTLLGRDGISKLEGRTEHQQVINREHDNAS